MTTQLLAVDTTLPVNVTNAFDERGLHPTNFFDGYQLRINEVYQKAGTFSRSQADLNTSVVVFLFSFVHT